MKKEKKYRGWDKEAGLMYYSDKNDGEWRVSIHGVMCRYCGENIMEYIGLKDKNGKEIYEDDLISENGSSPYRVVWQFHSVQWIMQALSGSKYYRQMAYDYALRDYEVIGNVYENTELLNLNL